jgi:hypothetical protein
MESFPVGGGLSKAIALRQSPSHSTIAALQVHASIAAVDLKRLRRVSIFFVGSWMAHQFIDRAQKASH